MCLIPTTIGALLSAIGIAGMDRLVQRNVLAMSGRAVEAAGDCATLLLDKTGTITLGNRQAAEFLPLAGVDEHELAEAAQLASLADETPEGRSIVVLAKERYGLRERDAARRHAGPVHRPDPDERASTSRAARCARAPPTRSGAGSRSRAARSRPSWRPWSRAWPWAAARRWRWPSARRVLGVIHLKDVVKQGMAERFDELRRMGIRTVMITGDNPLTARAIATEAGVDDFLAEATPEDKMLLIKREQEGGRLVAMTGDGTNDAPALAQADVGVAMNTGTQAAKEAGNMVDLDSNPTKLIEIVEIGKQLLITRGSLTTFSIANDVAKYFAIIPAMFVGVFPQLDRINVMQLETPRLGHPLGRHLQRPDHRGADPPGAAGRQVRGRRGRRRAAPQPAHLRRGRARRPVRRHQGHRRRHHRPGGELTCARNCSRACGPWPCSRCCAASPTRWP